LNWAKRCDCVEVRGCDIVENAFLVTGGELFVGKEVRRREGNDVEEVLWTCEKWWW